MVEPAHYLCLKCQHEWLKVPDRGEPSKVVHPICPRCGSAYLKWLDFDGWRKRNPLCP